MITPFMDELIFTSMCCSHVFITCKENFSIRFRVGVELLSGSLDRHTLEREIEKGQIQEDVDPELDMLDNKENVEKG